MSKRHEKTLAMQNREHPLATASGSAMRATYFRLADYKDGTDSRIRSLQFAVL